MERFQLIKEEMLEKDFDKIPEAERLHPNRVLCGMLKLASVMKKPEQFDIHGEHHYVLFDSDLKDDLSDDEIRYLIRCGIYYSSEYYSLAMFAHM